MNPFPPKNTHPGPLLDALDLLTDKIFSKIPYYQVSEVVFILSFLQLHHTTSNASEQFSNTAM